MSVKTHIVVAALTLASPVCATAQGVSDIDAYQSANTNHAFVEQEAEINILALRQSGRRNTAEVSQRGIENFASIFQRRGENNLRLRQAHRRTGTAQFLPSPFANARSNRIRREAIEQDGYITYVVRYRNRGFDLLSVTTSEPAVGILGRTR